MNTWTFTLFKCIKNNVKWNNQATIDITRMSIAYGYGAEWKIFIQLVQQLWKLGPFFYNHQTIFLIPFKKMYYEPNGFKPKCISYYLCIENIFIAIPRTVKNTDQAYSIPRNWRVTNRGHHLKPPYITALSYLGV